MDKFFVDSCQIQEQTKNKPALNMVDDFLSGAWADPGLTQPEKTTAMLDTDAMGHELRI